MKQLYYSCLLFAALVGIATTGYGQAYTITYQGLTGNTSAQGVPTGITVVTPYNGVVPSCVTSSNGATTSYQLVLAAAPGYNFTITSIGGTAYASNAGSRNFSFQLINGTTYTSAVTSIGSSSSCGGNTALTPLSVPSPGQLVTSGNQVTIKVIRAPGSTTGGGYSWTRSLTITGVVSAACTNPSSLAAANITTTTADLSWSAASGATDYQYAVSTSSTAPASGTTISGTSFQATNLTPATNYYLHVRTNCGSAFSSWVSLPFTTLAGPAITAEPHDTTTCIAATAGFSVTATNATAYQWQEYITSWNDLADGGIYSGATTTSLAISDVTGLSGNKYRCIVSGANPPNDTSYEATLTVTDTVKITAQPVNALLCAGGDTLFAIAATDATGYQWQVNTGSGFTDITNNATYSGTDDDTLIIQNTSGTMDAYEYRCIAMGSCNINDTSGNVILTVNTPPVITMQPNDTITCENSDVAFMVAATGSDLTYQWQVSYDGGFSYSDVINTLPYIGVNDDTLIIQGVISGLNGFIYRCIVNGTCAPSDTSNGALLNINIPLMITSQPVDTSICEGLNTYYAVGTLGADLVYQWQVNDGNGFTDITNTTPYSDATTDTLHITGATAAINNYEYRCIIQSGCAEADTTDTVTLHIHTAPIITTQPSNVVICQDSAFYFGLEADGTITGYQWQVDNGSGFTDITNSSIYAGATSDTLQILTADVAMNSNTYRCIVTGQCTPSDTSDIVSVQVNGTTMIAMQPAALSSVCPGDTTAFVTDVTGTNLVYAWEVNDGNGYTALINDATYEGVATDSLAIRDITTAMNGYTYRCIISGDCGADTTDISTLNVNIPPSISMQPADDTACINATAMFAVTATGTNLTYQWQEDQGSGFADLINTTPYSGVHNDTLEITASLAMSGYSYRCIITGACAPADTTDTASLYVHPAMNITMQPSDAVICSGNDTSFMVAATGADLVYQWQVNDGNGYTDITNNTIYAGANNDTLSLMNVPAQQDGYTYRCVVTDVCMEMDTTNETTLTVHSSAMVTTQPMDATICMNNDTSFHIMATGTGAGYQWQVNDGNGFIDITNNTTYDGATTDSLVLMAATTAMDNYTYRCIVTGTCNNDTSNIVALHVNTQADITMQPMDATICMNNDTSFHIMATGTAAGYQWQANDGNGFIDITNNTTYDGSATDSLIIMGATTAMDNYTYRCIVTGTCNNDTSSIVALHVNTQADIIMQPVDATICMNNDTSFHIMATGTGAVYQWQVNDGNGFVNITNNTTYDGATTDSLVLMAATTAMDNYTYRCIVTGTCNNDTSSIVALHVNTQADITMQPVDATICMNNDTSFHIMATGTGAGYQWQVNDGNGFIDITNNATYDGSATDSLVIMGATTAMDNYTYRCIVTGTCNNDTSSIVALHVNTQADITMQPMDATICMNNDTSFHIMATGTGAVYQWQMNDGNGFTNITNNTNYDGATTDSLVLMAATTAMNNYTYRCIVTGTCNNDTSNIVTLHVNTQVDITMQPMDATVCMNNDTSFHIMATGTAAGYQWQVNDGNGFIDISNNTTYDGATTDSLVLMAATTAMDNYTYRCIVTGTCNNDTSSIVALHVNTQADITMQPMDATICMNNDTSFHIMATGTGAGYQWQVNDGNGFIDITNNTTYDGATTDSLVLMAATTAMDNYTYRCIVTGTCNNDTSNIVALHVNTPVTIATQPMDDTICSGNMTYFAVVASGTGAMYQWQVNDGNGFIDVTNTTPYTGADNDTLWITAATTLNSYTYRCIVSGACSSDTTDTVTLTVRNEGQWTGSQNTSWSEPANWGCGVLPSSATDVTIDATATNMPVIDINNAMCHDITIASGASIMFTGSSNSLNVSGDLINNGTFDASAGKVILSGTTPQMIAGGTYRALEINGTGMKTLTGSILVTDELILTSGLLDIGANDLSIGSAATITGGNANSFVMTNSTGALVQHHIGTGGKTGNILFPVGSSSAYTPLLFNNAGTADTFRIRVADHFYTAYTGNTASGTTVNNNVVDKTWFIDETVAGGTDATITLQWNAANELAGFDRNACYSGHYYGGFWHAGPLSVANGSDPYTITLNNVNTFSPFGVGSDNSPLPVRLLSFTGKQEKEGVHLNWITTNETGVRAFHIERSDDGKGYEPIGSVKAKGTGNNTYDFTDNSIIKAKRYYRLNMEDYDNSRTYSNIVVIDPQHLAAGYKVYPNPVEGNELFIEVTHTSEPVTVKIIDMTGKVHSTTQLNGTAGSTTTINVQSLPAGAYLLHFYNNINQAVESVRFDKL